MMPRACPVEPLTLVAITDGPKKSRGCHGLGPWRFTFTS